LDFVLCRVSDAPLDLIPVLEELCWFAALGALAIELPRLLRSRFLGPADVTVVLTGAAAGGLWLVALRTGLRPHGRLADLEPWAWVFALACAYSLCFVLRSRWRRLAALLLALQGVLVALGIWSLGIGGIPTARLVALIAIAALLVGLTALPRMVLLAGPIGAVIALVPVGGGGLAEPRWSAAGPVPEGPDVFLIVADTLRADAAAGMESIERLAREGADLGPAQASSPWTLPSMGSALTGHHVSEHGAARLPGGGYAAISEDVPTLAERLADAGYDTAALVARNPNLSAAYGFARGFAVFDFEGSALRPWSLFPLWGNRSRPLLHQLFGTIAETTVLGAGLRRRRFLAKSTAPELIARARFVLDHRRDRPLFLWLHFMDPHLPYLHLPEQDLAAGDFARLNLLRHESPAGDRWFDRSRNRELVRRIYLDEVARLDAALVGFLDGLGPAPPNGRVIVLTADHGEELWEHGGFEHGHTFHQEVTAVPLAISGLRGEASVGRPAALVDLAPTILRAAGLEAGGCSGVDLSAGIGPRALPMENLRYAPAAGAGEGERWEGWFAVRHGALVLHDQIARTLLFDLAADPGERDDLSEARPNDVERLRALGPGDARRGDPVEIGEDEREALRALGYME